MIFGECHTTRESTIHMTSNKKEKYYQTIA